jgi:hypothetical protein
MGAAGTKREPKHNLLSPFDRARGRLLVAPRSWVWMCTREQLAAVLRIYRRLAIESDMKRDVYLEKKTSARRCCMRPRGRF